MSLNSGYDVSRCPVSNWSAAFTISRANEVKRWKEVLGVGAGCYDRYAGGSCHVDLPDKPSIPGPLIAGREKLAISDHNHTTHNAI